MRRAYNPKRLPKTGASHLTSRYRRQDFLLGTLRHQLDLIHSTVTIIVKELRLGCGLLLHFQRDLVSILDESKVTPFLIGLAPVERVQQSPCLEGLRDDVVGQEG